MYYESSNDIILCLSSYLYLPNVGTRTRTWNVIFQAGISSIICTIYT